MKTKIVAGLLILFGLVLIPSISSSKDTKDVITLTKDNTLILNSQVDGESVGPLISKAQEMDANLNSPLTLNKNQPLYLFLNTPGGSIQDGLELIESLNGLGRKVNTVTLFAASMGFQIAQNLGDRLILKNGVLMSHHAKGESSGEFGGSQPTQMQNRQKLWDDRVREMDEQTVRRTNGKQTYESYTKEYDHEVWLTGTKSVNEGYADRVVLVKCDSSLNGTTKHSVDFLGMTITYELSNCPLNTAPSNVQAGGGFGGIPVAAEYANRIKAQFLADFNMKAVTPLPWTN